jgi:hypothetical protein
VNEAVLAKECEEIEKCAAAGKSYYYNTNWKKEDVSHLKEYASTCGLNKDNVKGVDPTELKDFCENKENPILKTASVSAPVKDTQFILDPFHFEKLADTSHMDKKNWQEVKSEAKLKEAPVMANGIVQPLRGGENYFKNSDSKLASNQNSITNANAIKELAESTAIDNGARLKAEQKKKIEAKNISKKEWEQNLVESMKDDVLAKGKVFPTEVLNAQPGLNAPSSKMGVYAKFDPNQIPEKTVGEKIKENNKQAKLAIQRQPKEKSDFKVERAAARSISGLFSEELKKQLNK